MPAQPPENPGEKDVAPDGKPVKFILVRELRESVTEELFAKGMEKLYVGLGDEENDQAMGAQPNSLRRVLLIRDRRSEQSMGYGFAEYYSVDDANAAMRKAHILDKRDKLTVSSKPVIVAFPHVGIFPPADLGFGRPETNEKYLVKIFGSNKWHKYRDTRYYASELIINAESPYDPEPAKEASGDDFKIKGAAAAKATLESTSKKRKAPSAAPAYLNHFQKKAAELRGIDVEADQNTKGPIQLATGVNAISAPATETEYDQTFAYEGSTVVCYLCNTQFKSRPHICAHLRDSSKHANNLQDQNAIDGAYQRLKKAGINPDSTIKFSYPSSNESAPREQEAATTAQYRDRAAERRQEATQQQPPTKISFSVKQKQSKATSSPYSSDNDSGKPVPTYGIGANLLQKAGWSQGQGLGSGGATGDSDGGMGITAPIEQSMYAAGVGLGHEGSKQGDAVVEAERATRGGGFLEKTREQARKRFEEMK